MMQSLRALIVDDERLARIELRTLLAEYANHVEVVGEASSKQEALVFLKESTVRPDVIFLDINMPYGSGFDVLEEIDYEGEQPIQIVFVTAYDEYAVRAFTVNALDYILKPVDPDRLGRTMKRLARARPDSSAPRVSLSENVSAVESNSEREQESEIESQSGVTLTSEDYVFVTVGKQRRFVPVLEVVCITANDNYSELWLADGKRSLMLRTMSEWEVMLPTPDFIRIHRGTIVNRAYIDSARPLEMEGRAARLYLRDIPEPFAVSRRALQKLKLFLD